MIHTTQLDAVPLPMSAIITAIVHLSRRLVVALIRVSLDLSRHITEAPATSPFLRCNYLQEVQHVTTR